jgi:hypothetical protein
MAALAFGVVLYAGPWWEWTFIHWGVLQGRIWESGGLLFCYRTATLPERGLAGIGLIIETAGLVCALVACWKLLVGRRRLQPMPKWLRDLCECKALWLPEPSVE